jgi:hypothetical protein
MENNNTLFPKEEIRQLNKECDKRKLESFFYSCLTLNGKAKEYSQKISQEWSEKMTAEDRIINEIEKNS